MTTPCCVASRRHTSSSSSTSSPSSPSPISPGVVVRYFLQAFADGSKLHLEQLLDHNFVFEQMPMPPMVPAGGSQFKYDFLRRVDDMPHMFSQRRIDVVRLLECAGGTTVVCELKSTLWPAVDVGIMKKGVPYETVGTMWFDVDSKTSSIVKLKSFDCPLPYPPTTPSSSSTPPSSSTSR
eukprot:CAMPEP_0176447500 /NCGR_PEP_ID=MMETSP0127-20121128/25074_1 /TAXON_ID=938130 /ORGANISM="Platyophrya macrostoma, Strain WH" /LENGTH=179 /DNA_ID=CAMNT_0017833969 /DNA_START=157 /DNA_END=696 /DNA_ORIENTATION=-